MATNQVIPETVPTPEPSHNPFDCLTDKQLTFVKAYAKQPWNQANAERAAGYSQGYAADLLARPRIIQAITEEREALQAQSLTGRDVILSCQKLVANPDASDMARVRALELIADIQGLRKSTPSQAPAALAQSASFLPQSPQLEAANSELRRLNPKP